MLDEEGSRKMAQLLAVISKRRRQAAERERMMRKGKKDSSKAKGRPAK